jgi:hypothetical protein
MKVSFEGAGRFCGSHVLMDRDLSDFRLEIQSDTGSGDVEIESTTVSERLGGGRYRVRVRLTKKEIANLAKRAFRNESFGEVVDSLSRCETCGSRKRSEFEDRLRQRREERHKVAEAARAG